MHRTEHLKPSDIQDATSISRRNFLTNTVMAGAGIMLTPVLASAYSNESNNINNPGDKKLNKKDNKMNKRTLADWKSLH